MSNARDHLFILPKIESENEVVQVHAHIIKFKHDPTLMVCNSLINSYCKTGRLDLASQLFKECLKKRFCHFECIDNRVLKRLVE
jgi:pentatricopeptide repeat protein